MRTLRTCALLLVVLGLARAQDAAPGFEPTLRLEKPRYVLGEDVRFWVGMRSTSDQPIPEQVMNSPCRLRVTDPHGSSRTRVVPPSIDRLARAREWHGAMDLDQKIEAGAYRLVWECSNQQTRPVRLTVEQNAVLDQIEAKFSFERTARVKMDTSVSVVLSVVNHSPYTISFPQPGTVGGEVSVGAIREEPYSYDIKLYPEARTSPAAAKPEIYTWDTSSAVHAVILQPGGRLERTFFVEDAYSFDQPGKYRVMFSTVLQILVGAKDGPFGAMCP